VSFSSWIVKDVKKWIRVDIILQRKKTWNANYIYCTVQNWSIKKLWNVQHIDVKLKHKTLHKVLVPKTQNPNLDKLCSHNKKTHVFYNVLLQHKNTKFTKRENHKDIYIYIYIYNVTII